MNTTTASTAILMPPTNPSAPLTADAKTPAYEVVRFNALKHGILSRYTVLSHENHADYESLVSSLMAVSNATLKLKMPTGGRGKSNSTNTTGWCTPRRRWVSRPRCWST